MLCIYTTLPDKKRCQKMAKHLLEKKLIVCANIFPISSMYPREGEIVNEKEWMLECKGLKKNGIKTQKEITKIHPYEIPYIASHEIQVNKSYISRASRIK